MFVLGLFEYHFPLSLALPLFRATFSHTYCTIYSIVPLSIGRYFKRPCVVANCLYSSYGFSHPLSELCVSSLLSRIFIFILLFFFLSLYLFVYTQHTIKTMTRARMKSPHPLTHSFTRTHTHGNTARQ